MRMGLSWILTLVGGFTAFIGLTMLVLLPIQAAHNRDLHERVKAAAAYVAKTGQLPEKLRYRPDQSGINSMWVDKLDDCDSSFVPPRSDRFVIGFWQQDWWHCYGYPSGKTTLQTSVPAFLASEAGVEILINAVVAAAAFWGAARLRRGAAGQRDLSRIAKAGWFGAFMIVLNFLYIVQDSTDDQFIYAPGHIKWFVRVCDVTIGAFEEMILQNIATIGKGSTLAVLGFLFWSLIFYLIFLLSSTVLRRRATSDATVQSEAEDH